MMKRQKKEGTQMIESLREYVNYIRERLGSRKERKRSISFEKERKRGKKVFKLVLCGVQPSFFWLVRLWQRVMKKEKEKRKKRRV